MTEEAILARALRIPDPAERVAFLDKACAGRTAERRRIEDRLSRTPAPGTRLERNSAWTRASSDAIDKDEELFLEPSNVSGSIGRLGHYEIQSLIGRGGMGVVLKAHDAKLQRVVALKVMSPALADNATARKRFVREARSAAAVAHDNIVAIHAVEDEGPLPYLVMQFVPGTSLADRLRQGPLSVPAILRIGAQIAAGLEAAHNRGLIHRDIKPANILLTEDGERVKITDFGLARACDDASITQSGIVVGTPQYMSPEQAQGKPLDPRSDLFSLGGVLYAMCTGRPAFSSGTTLAVLRSVCDDAPRPIRDINPDIPAWLARLIDTLLAKRPDERIQSAAEVAELLQQRLARVPQPSPPAPTVIYRPFRRRKRTLAVVLAVALPVLALLLFALFRKGETPVPIAGKSSEDEPKGKPEPRKAPGLALAPFDGKEAAALQEAWAAYLGVEVGVPNSLGMKLRLVPPAEFIMGSPDAVIAPLLPNAFNDNYRMLLRSQMPRHRVRLPRPIFVGACEVTQGQYRQVMKANPSFFAGGGKDTSDLPVENVTWFDAIRFCNGLSELEGRRPCYRIDGATVEWVRESNGYRLPTEAEWEFVCRAGTTTTFPWGNTIGDWEKVGCHNRPTPRSVGQGQANAFGLFDLFGNVSEYCFDAFDFNYYAVAEGADPIGPKDGAYRVVRGSACHHPSCDGGSAYRSFTLPTEGNRIIGFRVVCAAEDFGPLSRFPRGKSK